MAPRLTGRTILITGAGRGIGRAAAQRAAAEGAALGLIDLDVDALAATAESVRHHGTATHEEIVDVADRVAMASAVASCARALGGFDGVFANAAILPPPAASDTIDWADWDRVLDVDLTGAVATLVTALPHVRDGASLLVAGSSLAIRPRPERLAYVAAKAGLHAAARALALELAPRRIRVNVIAPGLTDTPMVRMIPGHVETGLPDVPLGTLVEPAEIAALVVHLFSDDARTTTGAVFTVDGGRTVG